MLIISANRSPVCLTLWPSCRKRFACRNPRWPHAGRRKDKKGQKGLPETQRKEGNFLCLWESFLSLRRCRLGRGRIGQLGLQQIEYVGDGDELFQLLVGQAKVKSAFDL